MELKGKISVLVGDINSSLIDNNKEVYVLEHVDKYAKSSKIVEALSMVNLSQDYLLMKSNDLSNVEYRKLLLVTDLVNKEKNIVLEHFDKGLSQKEKQYFKVLFRKLSNNYGINFLVITNDLDYCMDLADEYLVYKRGKITKTFSKNDVFNEELYSYFDKHTLVDFIIKSRKFDHIKDDYFDIKDVLKAIYRELK